MDVNLRFSTARDALQQHNVALLKLAVDGLEGGLLQWIQGVHHHFGRQGAVPQPRGGAVIGFQYAPFF